jgi:hypothetical protein
VNIHFVCVFCNWNAAATVIEYKRQFLDWQISDCENFYPCMVIYEKDVNI